MRDTNDDFDDGTYTSSSTIERPPAEEKEPAVDEEGQAELPGLESEKCSHQGRQVSFKLTLKADGYTLPVASGKCPADMVEESLGKGLHSERFRQILRGVVGDPLNQALCDSMTVGQREQVLGDVVRNYGDGLKSLRLLLPDVPESKDFEFLCGQINDCLSKITQIEETAARGLRIGTESVQEERSEPETEKGEGETEERF